MDNRAVSLACITWGKPLQEIPLLNNRESVLEQVWTIYVSALNCDCYDSLDMETVNFAPTTHARYHRGNAAGFQNTEILVIQKVCQRCYRKYASDTLIVN